MSPSVGRADDLLVVMNQNGCIERYDAAGKHLGTASRGISSPNGLRTGPDGRWYITTGALRSHGSVQRYNPLTGNLIDQFIDIPAGQPGALLRATTLAWHEGDLFVTSCDSGEVFRYDAGTGAFRARFAAGSVGGLTQIAIRDHKLYVADYHGNGVRRFDLANGNPEGFAVRGAGVYPWGVAFDARGRLYWSGSTNEIRCFDGKEDKILAARPNVDIPVHIQFGPDGLLYAANLGSQNVTVFDPADGNVVRKISGPEMRDPIGLEWTKGAFVPREMASLTSGTPGQPSIRAEFELDDGSWTFLGWDTEGGDRTRFNLVRAPLKLQVLRGGKTVQCQGSAQREGEQGVSLRLRAADAQVDCLTRLHDGGMSIHLNGSQLTPNVADRVEIVLPFDITLAATCPIPAEWTTDGKLQLPTLLHAPDIGTMLVSCVEQPGLVARWEGSRTERQATFTFECPVPMPEKGITLQFRPWRLAKPLGVSSESSWIAARRGWLNLLQLSARQNVEGHRDPTPPGLWANNIISDPVCNTTFFLADHVLCIPELAPGIKATNILKRTIDFWLDHPADSKTGRLPYVVSDRAMGSSSPMMSDSNPSVLVAAWGYVEASGDTAWLRQRIGRLEAVARYVESRDIDGDGLVESPQSGNRGTHAFGDTAWDTFSSGHKNAYVNALAYAAFKRLAHLERRIGRAEQAAGYLSRARSLEAVFHKTFFNPETGWLGWWRSEDGNLHDVWSDVPTSMAVVYGLVPPEAGCAMLDRHWAALEKSGFKRFDLGIPLTVRPVHRDDQFAEWGGRKEDGSDTFGKYLNGGCCVSNTSFWLKASYICGRRERADAVLHAMLERQQAGPFGNGGGFQNGIRDRGGEGAEFFTWDGKPCGYEGHLVYSWTWLQALVSQSAMAYDIPNRDWLISPARR